MTDTSADISPEELSRRDFMDRSIKAIGAFVGLTMGVSAAGYLISPALQRPQEQWIHLARASQVQTGIPTLFTVTLSQTTGWVKSEINLGYFVYTEDAVNFIVMSNICTHLGCQNSLECGCRAYRLPVSRRAVRRSRQCDRRSAATPIEAGDVQAGRERQHSGAGGVAWASVNGSMNVLG